MNLRSALRKCAAAYLCVACVAAGMALAEERMFEVKVVARRVVQGPRTIGLRQGETAELRWVSDEAMEVHVHGYDVKLELRAGVAAKMRVDAKYAGRFPVTAHLHGTRAEPTLLYLEVHPQ